MLHISIELSPPERENLLYIIRVCCKEHVRGRKEEQLIGEKYQLGLAVYTTTNSALRLLYIDLYCSYLQMCYVRSYYPQESEEYMIGVISKKILPCFC